MPDNDKLAEATSTPLRPPPPPSNPSPTPLIPIYAMLRGYQKTLSSFSSLIKHEFCPIMLILFEHKTITVQQISCNGSWLLRLMT